MGCDIHLKLERRIKNPKRVQVQLENEEVSYQESSQWERCSIIKPDSCWTDRIYGMFAVMAGVRNYSGHTQIVPDRGYPEDACYYTDIRFYKRIYTDGEEMPSYYADGGFIDKQTAEIWVEKYECKTFVKKYDKYSEPVNYITNPDNHTPNWCTTEELEKCINEVFKDENGNWIGDYSEWTALLGAMKGYEMSGKYECRAVYWFDN